MDTAWNPGANNVVRALALSGSSLYVGGEFNKIGVTTRVRLAKLDATTGALDPNFLAASATPVNALAVVGSYVYAGTDGTINAGAPVSDLGRFDTTGTIDPSFSVINTGSVWALAVSGTSLFAGGGFPAPSAALTRAWSRSTRQPRPRTS